MNSREMNRRGNGGSETKNGGGRSGEKRMRRAARLMTGILLAVLLAGCGRSERPAENVGAQEAAAAEETEVSEAEMAATEDAEASEKETAGADGPVTMADLLKENGNGTNPAKPPELPETVLWFNATYACLTYTNGWDWRWVAGQEPTEENAERAEYLLYSSWDVTDRKSGVETVNNLLEGGHRAKCRECMDNLEDWGFMDLSEQRFAEEITKIVTGERTDIDLGDAPGRYVLAYYMYHSGIEAEYIAAWDLCRVNQLYAGFYVCGYMTYEEAMDASLENSLTLQKMYDSWEEMMKGYLLGYQFWTEDLNAKGNSRTKERKDVYEMILQIEDNPYVLDWDMKLKKSW